MGIFWESSDFLGNLQESLGHILGILLDFLENSLGIPWESPGNPLEFVGNTLGILWESLGNHFGNTQKILWESLEIWGILCESLFKFLESFRKSSEYLENPLGISSRYCPEAFSRGFLRNLEEVHTRFPRVSPRIPKRLPKDFLGIPKDS